MFDFHYQLGGARRRLFRVKGNVCSIGSARSNDLVVASRNMGKRHAELRLLHDGVHIRDLGSLGGCWVNRERVLEHGPLGELDEIVVGDLGITLVGASGAGRPAEPARATSRGIAAAIAGIAGVRYQGAGRDATARTTASAPSTRGDAATGCAAEAAHREGAPGGTASAVAERAVDGAAGTIALVPEPALAVEASGADERLAHWTGIVHEQLLRQMDLRRRDVSRMSDEELRAESTALIASIVASLDAELPPELDRARLARDALDESVGLGPLEQFLADESITEIMVNNHAEIFVERAGRLERSRYRFSSDRTVYAVIERIITPLGRRIDESSPIVDARLKDGSRVNAIIPPLALKGPSVTIRKFPKRRLGFDELVAAGSIDARMVDFLRVCVERRRSIVVSGGTGSGKTTLLNALSGFVPDTERVVTIEDAAELRLAQPNLVSLEARPPNLEGKGEITIRELVRNALRMRPDRIVVGEVRGGEALDMLQAMNTGHDGSLTTVHANNPRDAISRLEVLVLMAGMELPLGAIREQLAAAVDLIVQQSRFPCGARRITRITEVVGVESGVVQLQDIFRFEREGVDGEGRVRGRFRPSGAIPDFYEGLRESGVALDLGCFSEGPAGGAA